MRLSVIITVICLSTGVLSAAEDVHAAVRKYTKIPAQALASALHMLAKARDFQLIYVSEDVSDLRTSGAVGELTSEEALRELLSGTGLVFRYLDQKTVTIVPAAGPGSSAVWASSIPPLAAAFASGLDAASDGQDGGGGPSVQAQDAVDDQEERQAAGLPHEEIEEIIVTGTNIRGIALDSSPTRTFTREDIQNSGAGTAQDFIETLTANFGGGSNANIPGGLPNDNTGASNTTNFGSFGSSVNLRGLGSGSTLVLLNGHRLAPASVRGDFTDISMIPASAIDRVEILKDGASSIYGSDAVAGVVNFILRDDFDGIEASLRYGTGTQNGTPDQYRASITAGEDWGSGHALLVYEFFDQDQLAVDDRRFTQKDVLPNFLLPSQEHHSAIASFSQDVTSNLDLFADVTYSKRNARQIRTAFDAPVSYDARASSESISTSAGGALEISGDWFIDFSGSHGTIDTRNDADIDLFSLIFIDTLRLTDSKMWTADAKVSGPLFELPGGELRLALGGHYRHESLISTLQSSQRDTETVEREAERHVYALFGEAFIPIIGPHNAVSGVERLELNISGRFADYSDFGTTANPKVGLLWSPFDGLNFRGSYSTSFKAPSLGRVGAIDFGASALRTSRINDRHELTPADPSIADVVVLTVGGTAKDLEAESSRAFTAGLDFYHEWGAHDLAFSATWFDIDFDGRIGETPIPGNAIGFDAVNIAFNNPDAFPEGSVVFSPTMQEISNLLDSLDRFQNPDGDDPFDAQIINFTGVARNLSSTLVRGYDFDLTYTYDLNYGSIRTSVDGTFLQDLKQQAASTTPNVEQLNTLFNPVDLKLRGSAGYSNDHFSANIFINYVDDYHVDRTADAVPIDSWTTVDANLSFDTKERLGVSILKNTIFRFSVSNILDEDPPLVPRIATLDVDGFDPTNASPLGRFISFEIAKRW